MIRGVLVGLCLIVLGPINTARGEAAGEAGLGDGSLPPFVERSDDDILILSLALNQYVLAEGLAAYQDEDTIWVPLTPVLEALEFPIKVSTLKGTAKGWFLNVDRRFELDLARQEVRIAGEVRPLPSGRVERHTDDLYASLSTLEDWFPLHFEMQFHKLTIAVTSLEALPLEERIEREKRRQGLERRGGRKPSFPRVEDDGPLFSVPFVDTSTALRLAETASGYATALRYSSVLSGAFAGLDTQVSIFGDDKDAPTVRARGTRYRPEGGLLGLDPVRQIALGDVTTEEAPLVATNSVGRGVQVSAYDYNRLGNQTRITLRGELAVGWEVELYRNGELIDYITEATDNRFEFKDIRSIPGLNVFRLVYYGPQGQEREEYRRFYASAGLMKSGQTAFRLAANQKNRDLIENDTGLGMDEDDGEWRFLAQAEHGLSERLTAIIGSSSLSVNGERMNYGRLGLRTNFWGAFSGADLAVSDDGGVGLGLRTQTAFKGVSVTAAHDRFSDFRSEVTEDAGYDGRLLSNSLLRLSGRLPAIHDNPIPVTISARHRTAASNETETELFGRLSSRIEHFALGAETLWRDRTGRDPVWAGTLRASTLFGNLRLRTSAGFDLKPEIHLESLVANADWSMARRIGARFSLRHDRNAGNPKTSLGAGMNAHFERFTLGGQFEVTDSGDYSVQIGLSFSWGVTPRDGDFVMKGRDFATQGMISPFVYLDHNGDRIYQEEEDEPLPNVRFAADGSSRAGPTNARGHAFLVNTPSYQPMNLKIDEASLKNPFLMPGKDGVSVVPRPGVPARVAFPVVQVGEADGTIFAKGQRGKEQLGGITIQVLDKSGTVVKTATSAFDGFYLVDELPVGRYLIQPDPQQLAELGYAPASPRPVTLSAEEPVAFGIDFVVRSKDGNRTIAAVPESQSQSEPPKQPTPQFGVHVFSFRKAGSLASAWETWVQDHPRFADFDVRLREFTAESGQRYTRMIFGPWSDKAAAKDACKVLAEEDQYCDPMSFTGEDWTPPGHVERS